MSLDTKAPAAGAAPFRRSKGGQGKRLEHIGGSADRPARPRTGATGADRLSFQARASLWLAAATAIFAVAYIHAASQIVTPQLSDPVGPKAFPYLIGAGLLACAGGLFLEGLLLFRETPVKEEPFDIRDPRWRIAAGVMGWTLLYFALFDVAGYLLATTAFLFGLILVFDGRRILRSALVAITFSAVTFVAFDRYLGVFLPGGPL